jgi:hypothetical protein
LISLKFKTLSYYQLFDNIPAKFKDIDAFKQTCKDVLTNGFVISKVYFLLAKAIVLVDLLDDIRVHFWDRIQLIDQNR